ncbi:hypothetical protein PROCH_1525 [Prochlorococcus marinus str. EQPAC1]|nr:hypothetical protein PROCH_1525 [Prochlorococcus marinus str. EQPAC1]
MKKYFDFVGEKYSTILNLILFKSNLIDKIYQIKKASLIEAF